jgi:hypothetical protein
MAYSTYRLLLPSVPDFFAGLAKSSWNTSYGPAKIIFASAGSGMVQAGIRAQHTTLYSSSNDARWVCWCGCVCADAVQVQGRRRLRTQVCSSRCVVASLAA